MQVQCVVTSPPYWGLRRYLPEAHPDSHLELGQEALHDCVGWATGAPCGHCYVCHLVAVLRGVREVLADDGVVWLNLGDTYVSGGGSQITPQTGSEFADRQRGREVICRSPRKLRSSGCDLAPKNLVGIPWRVALALQADGWILRQDVIWGKVAPMPESVQDRCTKSHEYVFLLAKQQDYFFDAAAISEPATGKLPGNIKHKYVDQAQVLAQAQAQLGLTLQPRSPTSCSIHSLAPGPPGRRPRIWGARGSVSNSTRTTPCCKAREPGSPPWRCKTGRKPLY